ncbi:MAG: chromosome segregation protein SMC [Verrucomicrobiota bacterium]
MHLQALRLNNFKSFADATTLRFEPGVTAVVGPNGCGKSNIADAIRWVLGEQSAKALRGGSMQDVIFEGTDSRRAAQLCEVALLLSGCEAQLGKEFHEVEIMRRVHRDGQSEYFFNGQACRLKDIHRLFMDTGIGRTSYSVMAQGQIDLILSSKPEERRAVFEEAAGITKYKSSRREAMNKLALTDQNLARVSDVVTEVTRQIGSLRRQAAKALRFKRLSFRLRHLSLAHSALQHAQLAAVVADLEGKVAAQRTTATERRSRLEGEQSALDEQKATRTRLQQRASEGQQSVFDLRSQKEAAENAANLAQIRRTGLQDRVQSSRDNLGELDMQQRELAAQADSGVQDKQQQLTLLGASDAVYQNRNRELSVAEAALARTEQELQQAKFAMLQMESSIARLRTDCTGHEVDQKTSAQRHEGLSAELDAIRAAQVAAALAASDAATRADAAAAEKARLHQEAAAGQQTIIELTREFRDAQRILQEVDRGLAQRSARLKLLQQLQEKWEGFGEGAKALLQGKLDSVLGGAKPAAISAGLEIQPESGKAVEALLGAAVEAVSVADAATARRVLEKLEADQIGSAVLRVVVGGTGGDAGRTLPVGLVPAIQGLGEVEPGHPAISLLSECYIADDLGAFLDFWALNPAFPFLAVATRKGELVDRRGLVTGGHLKKPTGGIVQRRIDLRETARALAAEQAQHDKQKAVIDALNARLAAAEQALEQKRTEVLAATQQTASVQTEQRAAQRSADDVAVRLRRMESELTALAGARQEAQARFEKSSAGLAAAEGEAAAQRERIAALDKQVAAVRTERDVKRDTLGQARLELAERRQKVEVIDRGLADMARRRTQLGEILVQRQQEIDGWTDQIEDLARETARENERGAQLAGTLIVAQQTVERVRTELAEIEAAIAAVETAQQSLRADADAAQAELGRNEVKLAEHAARAQFLAEDAMREFAADVKALDWKQLLWRADDDPPDMKPLDLDEEEEPGAGNGDTAEAPTKPRRKTKGQPKGEPTEADLAALTATDWPLIKTESDALRQRLQSMGAVNLVAIEEYADLKQRHDFLTTQTADLAGAKAELLKTIDEINRTSQEQFAITFEQVRKNFSYTFQTLFGGGVARLELLAGDDPLESGIEIVAQPPGTKLRGITLLSGGQRTLTAVALLFALYMVKPSPFCLLDELDAPLDESNIGRFTDLLKNFTGGSQFIIITHNKRTVAAADAIYGVTMEQRGVSKTVSMRFNHERGEAEAHAHPVTLAESVRGAQNGGGALPAVTPAPA